MGTARGALGWIGFAAGPPGAAGTGANDAAGAMSPETKLNLAYPVNAHDHYM